MSDTTSSAGAIYLITVERPDAQAKFYVGKSIDAHRRGNSHFLALRQGKHRNRLLQRAWNAYGEASFDFTILRRVSPAGLIVAEQEALDAMRAVYGDGRLLNIMKDCVETRLGVAHTDETRARLRETQKALWKDPEYRRSQLPKLQAAAASAEAKAARSAAAKQFHGTPEQRALNSERARSYGVDPVVKQRRKEANARPEVREKRSASAKRALSSPAVVERIRQQQMVIQNDPALKARIAATNATAESKAKRRSANSAANRSPDYILKQREIQKIRQNDPDVKARKSAAVRAAMATPEYKESRRRAFAARKERAQHP